MEEDSAVFHHVGSLCDLERLADINPTVRLGIGVIDIKTTIVETADEVAARIQTAATILGGVERIAYVHPDCGFWMLARSIADAKIRALVAGRDRFEGRPAVSQGLEPAANGRTA